MTERRHDQKMSPDERPLFPTSLDAIVAVEGIIGAFDDSERWIEAKEMLDAVAEANGEIGLRNALLLHAHTLSCMAAELAKTDTATVRRAIRDTIIKTRIFEDPPDE